MKQGSFDGLQPEPGNTGSADDGPAEQPDPQYGPLAARMRPRTLDAFIGQSHILGPGKPLREAVEKGNPHSMIFWGPPGTGKTTLANIIAAACDAHIERLSAVLGGVKDIRAAVERARLVRQEQGRPCILFVDEVHRFNKAQQDAFLPHIENGTVIFIGATTENPSFELNNALLSRARVYVLKSLDEEALLEVIRQALDDEIHGLGSESLQMDDAALRQIARAADGDARRALNFLEVAVDLAEEIDGQLTVREAALEQVLAGGNRRFDKGGDAFYEQISALHKAVRGSSPDAALYWLMRMLDGGCDPTYISRRLLRMASEDIGNADPRALQIALSAWDAMTRLGSPEGELALAQGVIYLACAPKSNAVYNAYNAVQADLQKAGSVEVPLHLRNAPTGLMAELDYGGDYRYAHDEEDAYAAGENYFPPEMKDRRYYHPVPRGLEQKIAEKLDYLRQRDQQSPVKRYTAQPENKSK